MILILVSHTRIFQHFLFLGLILLPECIIPYDFLRIIGVLDIFLCNDPYIDKVKLDRIFLQVLGKWYSERHWRCPRQK